MPDSASSKKNFSITRDARVSSRTSLPTLGTIVSVIAIAFLIYAFFSGISFRFYASFVFLFYGVTHSMWVSVMLLGAFQTLLMIPFRIMRIVLSNNIKEFQRTVEKMEDQRQQSFTLKKGFRQGNSTFLFYSVDFVMQLVSYISIGRLFLTDFYANKISPALLYDWVPSPQYPITDTFFKIPYPVITHTVDFGWRVLLPVWIVLVIVQVAILVARRSVRSNAGEETATTMFSGRLTRYASGYLLLFLLLSYLVVRHFPTGWDLQIFSGDVSIPNRTFNTVTAIITFLTLMWHGVPRIIRKGRLAEKLKVPARIIESTQLEMLKETLLSSALVGLGAFFITNQIPSAFELSIFTLEMISLAAPFTLDKIVLKGIAPENDDESDEEVLHAFGHDMTEDMPDENQQEKTNGESQNS